ncbi:MAG TPA: hypothetical protein VEY09_13580 [Pyrinomonadaceae bacterium]|nr:hypothetical protein [Pyrinomonadaceae bacterium]
MENVRAGGEGEPAETARAGETPAPARGEAGRSRSRASALTGRPALYAFGAVLIGAVFWYLQFSTASICCGDFDAYYHFRLSRMIWDGLWTGDFPPAFNALPFTTLNPQDFVDHHFLFHVMQIPFTWFSDFETGAKVGTWLFACAAVFACYWLMVRHRVSYPVLWLLAILGSAGPFLYRIHMGKAMAVSIVLLVAGIHLLWRRRYVWLLPLAFIFGLTYDMVFLLWVAAGFWFLVVLAQERAWSREVRRALVAGLLVVAGTGLGYVINPYFPHNVVLTYQHLLMKVRPGGNFSTAVGGEWYPYNTLEFLANCGTAFAAMIFGYVAFRDGTRKRMERALFLLLFSTFLMLVNMKWRRFAEYWPPFAVVFAAFALDPLITGLRLRFRIAPADRADHADHADHADDAAAQANDHSRAATPDSIERARAWEFASVGTLAVLLAAPLVWYARISSADIASMPGPDRYRGGVEWLKANVPAGEPVFNSDWDDFPKLFFYDPQRPWIAGLDPTYLLDRDAELMRHYERIGRGEETNPGPIIREKFCLGDGPGRRCARYAITDHEHEGFFNNSLDSGWFDVVYEDDDVSILRIRDAKGEPPPDNAPPANFAPDNAPTPPSDANGADEPADSEGAQE